MKKRKLAGLLLLALLVFAGVSPLLSEVVKISTTLLDSYYDEVSAINDGEGGGGGFPDGAGRG